MHTDLAMAPMALSLPSMTLLANAQLGVSFLSIGPMSLILLVVLGMSLCRRVEVSHRKRSTDSLMIALMWYGVVTLSSMVVPWSVVHLSCLVAVHLIRSSVAITALAGPLT